MASSKFTNYDHCCIRGILTKVTCHVFFLVSLIIGGGILDQFNDVFRSEFEMKTSVVWDEF